jgi:hypothetical protein
VEIELSAGSFVTIAQNTGVSPVKYSHHLKGGKKLTIRGTDCNLKVTKSTTEQFNIKCKPLPPTRTPTPIVAPTTTPTRTPTLRAGSADGFWQGKTNQGRPISFYVTGNRTSLNTFRMEFVTPRCTLGGVLYGPRPISKKKFKVGGDLRSPNTGSIVFKGTFTDNDHISGTWTATNAGHPACGTLNASGTWNAHWVSDAGSGVSLSVGASETQMWEVESINR